VTAEISEKGEGWAVIGTGGEEGSEVGVPMILPVATVTGKAGGMTAAGEGGAGGDVDIGSSCSSLLDGSTMRATSAILVLRRKMDMPGEKGITVSGDLNTVSSFFSSAGMEGWSGSDFDESSIFAATGGTADVGFSAARLSKRRPPERVRARRVLASAISFPTFFSAGKGSIDAGDSVGAGIGVGTALTVAVRVGMREAMPPVPGMVRCRDSNTLDLRVGVLEASAGARVTAAGFTVEVAESLGAGGESLEERAEEEETAGSSFRLGTLALKKMSGQRMVIESSAWVWQAMEPFGQNASTFAWREISKASLILSHDRDENKNG
jgi:hypothetical protein